MIFRKRLQDTFCLEFLAEVWRSTWQGKSNFWNCIIKNLTFVYTTCILMENRKVYILPCAKCCLKLKKVNSLIHIHISIFGFCLRLKLYEKFLLSSFCVNIGNLLSFAIFDPTFVYPVPAVPSRDVKCGSTKLFLFSNNATIQFM